MMTLVRYLESHSLLAFAAYASVTPKYVREVLVGRKPASAHLRLKALEWSQGQVSLSEWTGAEKGEF